jgi:hypothetical protein
VNRNACQKADRHFFLRKGGSEQERGFSIIEEDLLKRQNKKQEVVKQGTGVIFPEFIDLKDTYRIKPFFKQLLH